MLGTCRAGFALALLVALLSGCATDKAARVPPQIHVAPYDTSQGEALWAVVPPANESGVSFADTHLVADALAAKLDEVRGIACLPLNRTIAAMRALGISMVRTPAEARALAGAMGVDAVVVGSITAYEPYDPPKLGLALAVFARDGRARVIADPMKLQTAYSDRDTPVRSQFADRPVAAISEHFDGANHEVQLALQRYAAGRHEPGSALGWRGMLASMSLYVEFAAHEAVGRLIEQERLRLAQPPAAQQAAR
ncbi:MAG: hypothetical protein KF699_01105 [Phycisphaeraceae bacterium]|nr:hypothetical protein [Phycisphaeraceae bacterium]